MSDPATALVMRLDRLERAYRRWRLATLALAGLAAAVLAGLGVPGAAARGTEPALAWPRRAADTVEAQQFVLRDKSGLPRAMLAMSGDGLPILVLLDEREQVRAVLSQNEVTLSGERDTSVRLFVNPDGRPALRMEKDGKLRAVLGMTSDGILAFGLYDREGKGRALLDVDAQGSPGFSLFDKSGRVTWTAR
jgi:hypothetical protein